MTEYDTALIDLAGIGFAPFRPAVLAEFPIDHRWNGWLCPRMDALSVVEVLDSFRQADSYEEYGHDYDWREDGALLLTDRQEMHEMGDEYEPEVLMPNEDGLYDLGAYSWVWSYADWNADPYHRGE